MREEKKKRREKTRRQGSRNCFYGPFFPALWSLAWNFFLYFRKPISTPIATKGGAGRAAAGHEENRKEPKKAKKENEKGTRRRVFRSPLSHQLPPLSLSPRRHCHPSSFSDSFPGRKGEHISLFVTRAFASKNKNSGWGEEKKRHRNRLFFCFFAAARELSSLLLLLHSLSPRSTTSSFSRPRPRRRRLPAGSSRSWQTPTPCCTAGTRSGS